MCCTDHTVHHTLRALEKVLTICFMETKAPRLMVGVTGLRWQNSPAIKTGTQADTFYPGILLLVALDVIYFYNYVESLK